MMSERVPRANIPTKMSQTGNIQPMSKLYAGFKYLKTFLSHIKSWQGIILYIDNHKMYKQFHVKSQFKSL